MKTIALTQGQVTTVDDADFEALSKFKWCALKRKHTFYAVRGTPGVRNIKIQMHRQILGTPKGEYSDHRDGNGLNNQRHNLRVATKGQNAMSFQTLHFGKSSRFRGVCWREKRGKWEAYIKVDKTYRFLGRYGSEKEAAQAYDRAALHHFGEFAHVNFPDLTKFETLA